MPDSTQLDPGAGLIGRETEVARVSGLLAPPRLGSRALVITGNRGIGKSRLLAVAAQLAHHTGRHRVLSLHAPDADAPALIRQLLLTVRRELPGLPDRHARTALGFLGLADGPVPTDPAALRAALAAALAAAGRAAHLVLVADDVHRFTPDAAAVLAGLTGVVPTLLFAGRRDAIPAALAGFPVLELEPLDVTGAVRLYDAQDRPPAARQRAGILRRAAGNPAAIVELTTAGPAGGRLWSAFAADVAALPEPTRRLLLHLAASTPPTEAHTVLAAAGPAAWEPAERAGLIVRRGATADFTHPLAAEAVYRTATAADRRAAHLSLAAARDDAPEWQALHHAAATSDRDETIAAGLETAAGVFRARGELFDAASAMHRAAERSPRPDTAARRFAQAAVDARNLGEPDWTGELYATVRRLTDDPDLVTRAAHAAAAALSRSGRQNEAYGVVAAARRTGTPTDRRTRLTVTGLAAGIAAISGHEEHRHGLAAMLAESEPLLDPATAAFVRSIMDPASHPGRALCDAELPPRPGAALTTADRHRLNIVGTVAGYEDRSQLAVDLLRPSLEGASISDVESLPMLIGALIDTGEWDLAERYADRADARGTAGLPVLGATVNALRAQLLVLRGHPAEAVRLARSTWSMLDIQQHRSIHVRLLRATGLAAMAGGDYDDAYRRLRSMFDRDGRPLQTFVAGRCITELALAAVRIGHRDDVRVVLDRVRADAGEEPSTRMRLLLHVAEALLADGDRAEHHFRLATVDPAGQEWPFERAIARLHYGTWLRRARRPRDARGVLSAAASAFADLGAAGAARLATRELRAGGQHDEPVGPTPLSVLTPQERQVAELAARGLRNREIAEHLFISVRTVDAHLHSVYPKLGISGRHQLRDAAGRT